MVGYKLKKKNCVPIATLQHSNFLNISRSLMAKSLQKSNQKNFFFKILETNNEEHSVQRHCIHLSLHRLLYFKCSHLLIPLQVPPSQKPALKLLMSTVLHLKSLRQDIFHFVSMEIWWIWYSNLPPIWCIFIGILINPNS